MRNLIMKNLFALRPSVEFSPSVLDDWQLKLVSISDWADYQTKKHLGKKYELVIMEDNHEGEGYEKGSNNYEKFYVKMPHDKQMPVDVGDIVKIVGIKKLKIYGKWSDGLTCEAQGLVSPEEYDRLKAQQKQQH